MPVEIRSELRFILNGRDVALRDVAPDHTLLDWLRLSRLLKGTKEGCAEGDCGACTVLVGRLTPSGGLVYEGVNACIRFLGSLDGCHVVTVEHVAASDGHLHPVQQAMVDYHGSQCGFCTPGFVMSLYALWMQSPNPSDQQIETALQGNLCRCTGYEPILRAARAISSYGNTDKDPLLTERATMIARLKALRDGARVEIGEGKHRWIVPANLDDFAAVLEASPTATVVAGSTDVGLWVTKHMRAITPVFIAGLDELKAISVQDGVVSFGAGVTYSEAIATLSHHIPALGPLITRIGGQQVRNMGTIGGNIANGSPIGDTPPALIALDASLTLRKGAERRTIRLEDYFIAYGKQDRQPGEFVEAVQVPIPAATEKFAVYKVTKRRDEDITATLGAFRLVLADDGRVAEIRIAYGGMAATPKRAAAVEAALLGQPWTEATVEAAMEKYAEDFSPLTDMRATADYRALVAKNLLLRFYMETTSSEAPVQVSRYEAA
ncbi:xanthine dehydrogenase small subunit [Shinella sp. CPCC 100929]|uniref:Xanthine dehydrogenase small subunit n=1 Tax=Shinella lacus TaxID=2654216 RepID=A0ABT1RIK4_9HYPH|nr:xanthine dehydrogenase small subunit [Shinella lacus]MCQ4634826.1 xanthine dehydrogenase small subunit [Shinella lacus]